MRRLKLTLAYDGAAFAGWQAQPDAPSVQVALETAIQRVTGQQVRVLGSGRTDAGVHALAQVAAVTLETRLSVDVLQRALNAELPRDIAVLAIEEVPAGFHPIRDAHRKRYRYVIHDSPVRDVFRRGRCWQYIHGRLDADAMARAAAGLVGTHDFASFQTAGAPRETTVRTVFELDVQRGRGEQQDLLTIEIEADGFLYNMVRAIVGTLVEVGRGVRPETWPAEVLALRDRRAAGPTAPAEGLFLVRVLYDLLESDPRT